MVKTGLFIFFVLVSAHGWSQSFPVNGQTPSTAFPVCGSNTFKQLKVPQGQTGNLQVPGCGAYPDRNPFWYTFTCFSAGTLGFLITPNDPNDDYDWMLFDITGRNPNDVFTDISLVVIGNWAGTYGPTGADAGGVNITECGSDPANKVPTFSKMPALIKGHQYLLIVSHFTDSQSGYSLSFGGGTAIITDPLPPDVKSATIDCDRKSIHIALNKQMRCNSVASDGSDFDLVSIPGAIASASGENCNNGFDMTSVLVSLKSPLPPGDYILSSRKGTDGNTLLDDCSAEIPVGNAVSFTVLPPHPTPFDSLTTPVCAPNIVQLVFADPIQCSSIAPDGSDFQVTGSPAVQISKAEGVCTAGLTRVINITFSAPVVHTGSYQISLVTGLDGNTILNECGVETPPGGQLNFSTKDTVSAAFSYNILYGCKMDTISLNYPPANGVNFWHWDIDPDITSGHPDLMVQESVFGLKTVRLIVSNGFCSDTLTKMVNLDNTLKAGFQSADFVCPKDVLSFTNTTIGNVVSWSWDFGDGTSTTDKDPVPHLYPDTWTGKTYAVSLVVENNLGCFDTLNTHITKLQSCVIAVPNAFTPDGDGKNDFLYPLNGFMANELDFRVYNRFGQLVFETKDWSRKWDGTIGGQRQPVGTYVWTLQYTDGSGKKIFARGTSVLVR